MNEWQKYAFYLNDKAFGYLIFLILFMFRKLKHVVDK